MTPITIISEQIAVLAKSVILKTRMLIFLLNLCMTYGLPISGYSVSAQHLYFLVTVEESEYVLYFLIYYWCCCSLYLVVYWLTVKYSWLH